jgi:hypothetical protein
MERFQSRKQKKNSGDNMIPMLLKIKVPRKNKQPVSIYLPLFIVWLILIPFFILLLPILLLIVMLTWAKGYGRWVLLFFPMLFSILWNLQGLEIDVEEIDSQIYFSFI